MMQSTAISPISEVDVRGRAAMQSTGRRMSSTGGNRSWTEEEEAYLLRTRMQKMPYKHIAARLKKTELACRLHYHQLSHGSHRRKRTASVSSSVSSTVSTESSVNFNEYAASEATDYTSRGPSRQVSPSGFESGSPVHHFNSVNGSNCGSSNQSAQHKVLLPKPSQWSPQASPERAVEHQLSARHGHGLRLNTSDNVVRGPHGYGNAGPIDTERLRAIYEAHRVSFWSVIASEYGPDASPAHLESAWHSMAAHNHVLRRLPTPDQSPPPERFSKLPSSKQHLAHPFPSSSSSNSSAKSAFPPSYPPVSFSAPAVDRPAGLYHCTPHPSRDGNVLFSTVSADRSTYTLPTPEALRGRANSIGASVPSRLGSLSRTSTWGSTADKSETSTPRTAISALLTEDKCPRAAREDEEMRD